jgi:hypothetical protein
MIVRWVWVEPQPAARAPQWRLWARTFATQMRVCGELALPIDRYDMITVAENGRVRWIVPRRTKLSLAA